MDSSRLPGQGPVTEQYGAVHGPQSGPVAERPGRLAAPWQTATAVVGALLGLVPHVLHHIGLIAGAALITGVTGNTVLLLLGLVFSVPLLRRLYRRFHTWRAPAVAIAVFAALFSLSTYVIGPALGADPSSDEAPHPESPVGEHGQHH